MTSTIAKVTGKTYLCTVEIQESVHGSPCRFRLHYKKDQIESHLLAVGARAFSTVGQILGAGSLPAGKGHKGSSEDHIWDPRNWGRF